VTALAGRVTLLTGASGGIGKGIARALADEGADLFLSYGRHADDAEEVGARSSHRRIWRTRPHPLAWSRRPTASSAASTSWSPTRAPQM
jgi:NAD(P)-dependent dehydrogenase (short-subunit alcohol dehydrogenase family)